MADDWVPVKAAPAQGDWVTVDPHVGMSHTKPYEPKETDTTAAGMAGAIERGIAPVATGAAVGAGLGSLAGGVGAIPGAAAGAGAAGLTQLATELYKPLARYMNWGEAASPQDAAGKVLDAFGAKRPSNSVEWGTQAMAGGVANAVAGSGAANQLALRATNPVTKAVAGKMAEGPMRQAVSGALGGAGAQTAAEMGAGPTGQLVASLAAGGLPYGSPGLRSNAAVRPAALEARNAGYSLPPASISEKPGMISNILAGWSGKIKTQQAFSAKNQPVTNRLLAKGLGLAPDTHLTEEVFNGVRREAGKPYQAVIDAVPIIRADKQYQAAVDHLGGKNSQAAQFFPKITDNPGIKELVTELSDVKEWPTAAGVEVVKELRFQANSNLKAIGDPSKHALGLAQREAADAVDDLMERNIEEQTGKTGVVDTYRAARKLIAKS
jgi:hypothetical protein